MDKQQRDTGVPLSVFISYAHQDKQFCDELMKHLKPLYSEGIITLWHKGQIDPGTNWLSEIDQHLNDATLILLLISPDFLASDSCRQEIQQAMKRYEKDKTCVIPILLRPVAWENEAFAKLQVLPVGDHHPVAGPRWHTQDEAFFSIVDEIRRMIKMIKKRESTHSAAQNVETKPMPPISERDTTIPPPENTNRTQVPLRHPGFIGREIELGYYQKFIRGGPNDPWIMTITGLECVGKSYLLDQMRKESPQNSLVFSLDFADESLHTTNLFLVISDLLVHKIADYCDPDKISRFKSTWRELVNITRDTTNMSTMQANIAVLATEWREVLQSLERNRHLVIFLDNVERLSEHNKKGEQDQQPIDRWLVDTLIPEIHEYLQPSQCFVVMTSRTLPNFQVIGEYQREAIQLFCIDKDAIKKFLRGKNIPETLHDNIYELTYGHGLCFSLFYKIIQDKIPSSQKDLADITKRFYERAWDEFLLKRVMQRLKEPFRQMFTYCLEHNTFDFGSIKNAFIGEAAKTFTAFEEWEYLSQLRGYPCIASSEEDRNFYAVHPLMRTIYLHAARKSLPGAFKAGLWSAEDSSMRHHVSRALFVGRESEKTAYQDFLKQEQKWLLLIIGMTGTGKSRLLNHLLENAPRENAPIKLDFANKALQIDPLKILEDLSWKTRETCDSRTADEFITTLQDVRKHFVRLSSRTYENSQFHSSTDKSQLEQIYELRKRVLTALYDQLATYKKKQLVILLDTCEWLNDDKNNSVGTWLTNDLIPGLHKHVQGIALHIVMASRTRAEFAYVSEQDQQLLKLSMLEEDTVKEYLQFLHINDEQHGLNIYTITKGHPLCLSIIATLLQDETQNNKIREILLPKDVEKLEKKFTEQAFVELFQERLDSYLKFPYRELTHYGVLLRTFDLQLLQAVFQEIPSAEIARIYEDFIDYSYIETFDDQHEKRYSLHILLREVLVENIRTLEPEHWKKYQQRAADYYTAQEKSEHYYHRIALDEYKGMMAWQEAVDEAIEKKSASLQELLKILDDDHTLKISEKGNAIRYYVWGRYDVSIQAWETALEHYQKALKIFQQQNNLYYQALTLKNRGYIRSRDQNGQKEALNDYEKALLYFGQLGESLQESYVLKMIGDVKSRDKTQQIDAIHYYEQTIKTFDALGGRENQIHKARALQAIADVQPRGQWRQAMEYYRQALHILKDNEDSSLQDASTHNLNAQKNSEAIISILESMAVVSLQQKKWVQAIEACEQALPFLHQTSGSDRTLLAKTADIHRMQGTAHTGQWPRKKEDLRKARDHYYEASVHYRETGDSINERMMLQAIFDARPLPVIQRRIRSSPMLFIVSIFILLVVGMSVLFPKLPIPPFTCIQSPAKGIGAIPLKAQCGPETIGVSDGRIEFDNGMGNRDLKVAAAAQEQEEINVRQKNPGIKFSQAITLWAAAVQVTPNDAESLIYLEDLNVLNSEKPYITFVAATLLTTAGGDFVGSSRDVLQGAYVAQKDNNERCLQETASCPLIRLLIANSGSQFANATDVAQQIVMLADTDKTIVGVTGWQDSAPTMNAIKILGQKHMPMVSSTASSNLLTNISPYFFRVNPPDSSQGKAGAEYAQDHLHAKNVVLIEDPLDPYSASLAGAFQKNYDIHKGSIIVNKNYLVDSPNNLYRVLDDALHHQPDLIYFAGYPRDLSPMLTWIHESLTTVNVMGGDALYVPGDYTSSIQTLAAFPYLYFTSFAHPDQLKNDPDKQTAIAKLQFLQAYQHDFDPTNKYSQKPTYGYTIPDGQVILTFDAVNVLIKGYENIFPQKQGIYVTPDEMRRGLGEIDSSHPLQGMSGKIAFLQNGDPQQRNIVMLNGQSIDNEQIVQVYSGSYEGEG